LETELQNAPKIEKTSFVSTSNHIKEIIDPDEPSDEEIAENDMD